MRSTTRTNTVTPPDNTTLSCKCTRETSCCSGFKCRGFLKTHANATWLVSFSAPWKRSAPAEMMFVYELTDLLDNKALAYEFFRSSTSHFMMFERRVAHVEAARCRVPCKTVGDSKPHPGQQHAGHPLALTHKVANQ